MINNKESTAAWELTYIEFLRISKLLKDITYTTEENQELSVHHEYSKAGTLNSEELVKKILGFLEDRKINPFLLESQPLKNLVTGELVHPEIGNDILNIFEKAKVITENLLMARFIDKTETLTATIPRNNIPSFKSLPPGEKPKPLSDAAKKANVKYIEGYVTLAQERKYPYKVVDVQIGFQ